MATRRWFGLISVGGLALIFFWWIHFPSVLPTQPNEKPNLKSDILSIEDPIIIYKPIPFSKLRMDLTLDYVREHYDPGANDICIVPKMIIIHWSASSTVDSVFSAFEPDILPIWRWNLIRAGKVNVSAHFLVDRNGIIYQLMPANWMARHAIGLNRVAIGIENVGGPNLELNNNQAEANAALVRLLIRKYPTIEYLIGHHEYLRFRGTPLWQERDASYFTEKQDPGPEFMARLRHLLKDIELFDQYPIQKK